MIYCEIISEDAHNEDELVAIITRETSCKFSYYEWVRVVAQLRGIGTEYWGLYVITQAEFGTYQAFGIKEISL